MTTIKITQLTDIGANLATSTVLPVVNMAGTPTTQKTTVGNIANLALSQAGNSYPAAAQAVLAQTVTNTAQPNITSVGTLTGLTVSGNASINGNIISNGTAYLGNISTTGSASITTLLVGATSNLGAVGNITITGGSNGQVLTTAGNGSLSWTTATLSGDGGNISNIAGANVTGTVGNANLAQFIDVSDVNNNFSYHVVLSAGSGDKSVHIDADDNLQYNPADGTLTAVRVDATYVVADLQFSNGYPLSNVTGVGNIASINLTGSNSNVLYGNGVFAPVAGGANTGNVTFNGNVISTTGTNDLLINLSGENFIANTSNGGAIGLYSGNSQIDINNDTPGIEITSLNVNLVALANGGINLDATAANGVVDIESEGSTTITVSGRSWSFDDIGTLNFPASPTSIFGGMDNDFTIATSNANGATYFFTFSQFGDLSVPVNLNVSGNVYTNDIVGYGNSNVTITADANSWLFETDGILTVPGGGQIVPVSNTGVRLSAGASDATGLFLNNATDAEIYANANVSIYTDAGNIGWTFDNTGNLNLPTNGYINFNAGGIYQAVDEDFVLRVQDADDDGFSVNLEVDEGTGNVLSRYDQTRDQIELGFPSTSKYFQFNDDGRAVFPGNIHGSYGEGLNIELPGANTNSFVSIRTVDNTDTLKANVTVDIANVTISTSNAAHTWTFDDTGNLTLPGNTVAIKFANSAAAFGNIVSTNLDGSSSNVLYGNGAFAAAPSSTYGDSNVVTLLSSFGSNTISTTGLISGNGAGLTNLAGANVSGAVAEATLANTVAVSNVILNQEYIPAMVVSKSGNLGIKAPDGTANITYNPSQNRLTVENVVVGNTITASGKIGYASGANVTQTTSRSTSVTINALSGEITLFASSMAAGAVDFFTVTNNQLVVGDMIICTTYAGSAGTYLPMAFVSSNTQAVFTVRNLDAFVTASESPVIKFIVIKAPNA